MNWRTRLAAALAVGAALALGTGCGPKPADTTETKQPGTEQVARPLPTKTAPDPKRPPGKELTPDTKVSAEELAREFETDWDAAAARYVGKTFTVEGKLKDNKVVGKDTHMILEDQPGEGGPHIACAMKGYLKTSPFNHSRGQQLRVEGRCVGAAAGAVSFTDCAITGIDPDPTPKMTTTDLIAAYRTDAAGDAKYKGKFIRVENAEVEKMPQDGTLLMVPFARIPGSKPPAKKLRVEYDPSYKPLFPQLKEGGLATVYGRCEGGGAGEIVIKDAWFLPYIPVP
jgi:hypothetical protein